MAVPTKPPATTDTSGTEVMRIGCVGYLNAKPLIDGLGEAGDPIVRLGVPSSLLEELEADEVDIALCPVIDYYRSKVPLVIVPVGCIASDGPAQTVKLFSKVPLADISQVHADLDSHTSVALLSVLLKELHGLGPEVIPFDARAEVHTGQGDATPQAMLLIGDKVVHHAPSRDDYPHQMDLGEAWKELTGLPFVFAVWMARRDTELGGLPGMLDNLRERNAGEIDRIADHQAEAHGWSAQAAREYLGRVIHYRVGPKHLEAIERFANYTAELGLIDQARRIERWRPGA